MTNYVKSTDFAVKDSLISGNPSKLVKGTEINTEFAAIQSADATSVKGPGSSVDNAIMRFDGTAGYTAQTSSVTISDAGELSGVTNVTYRTTTTGSAVLPAGTTAQRDGTPVAGYLRYNSETTSFEGYSGGAWGSIGGFSGGTVASAITAPSFIANTNDGVQFANGSVQPAAAQPAIAPITASVTSNAITVSLAPCSLAFRNTTLTNGTPTYVNSAATISLVIAATDSFGAVTADGTRRIAILAINFNGVMELAASSLAGGVSLDETGVITTAATATTLTAIKAANVRTGVAYRVVGFVDVPFTTAVGWGALVTVQGQGGQALAAMSSLGYGQTYTNLFGTRAVNTTYYNTRGKPMLLAVTLNTSVAGNIQVNGVSCLNLNTSNQIIAYTLVVPPYASYIVGNASTSIQNWSELY